MFFGWVFFLISLGGQARHVLRAHMGRTCGEPNEIESPATHGLFCRSFPGRWRSFERGRGYLQRAQASDAGNGGAP